MMAGVGTTVLLADYAKEQVETKLVGGLENLGQFKELLADQDGRSILLDQLKHRSRKKLQTIRRRFVVYK